MTRPERLRISVGQHSEKGRKQANQDFHGASTPAEPLLTTKGCVVAIADGISTSDAGRAASESAVAGFLADYYATPEPWSVKTSAQRVLAAINSWLYAKTRRGPHRYDRERGYVCALSALVFKSTTVHVFRVGDARVYRLSSGTLEQLTNDHRIRVTEDLSYLGAALGIGEHVEIEYRALRAEAGDVFVLATDGVHEHLEPGLMTAALEPHADDLDAAARAIVAAAYEHGSDDNLTAQLVRIEHVPGETADELYRRLANLPSPPVLDSGVVLDGYRIVREVHASNRSHVYLAVDEDTDGRVALKTLSTELENDPAHLERFLAEEWIGRRVDNPHVAQSPGAERKRGHLYTVMEFIDGRTLRQWMRDNPGPGLESVRDIVEQIARGLRAFHRLEMIHQDLRPDNVMIDSMGTVKLIDFGPTHVAGVEEGGSGGGDRLGTAPYSAPECFLCERGSNRSDIFSIGVITYEMLTGRLPYGARLARSRSRLDQQRLRYTSVLNFNRDVPRWIDGPLKKALHTDPKRRYTALSEFLHDPRHPRREFPEGPWPPLVDRDPVLFWQSVSLVLAIVVLVVLVLR